MKKILGISLVAVFAVAPLMARAETGLASEPTHAATAISGNTTTVAPQYEVASADSTTDGNLATAGYVKGAYNAAIRGINKVAADAVQTANLADKSLTIDAASLSVNGAAVLTGADVANKADKATTLAGYGITDAYTKTQVDSAISSSATATLNSAKSYADGLATNYDEAGAAAAALNSAKSYADGLATNYDAAGTAATEAAAALNSAKSYADGLATNYDAAGAAAAVETALQSGIVATINASTVPVMTTWGSTAVDTTSLKVKAPAAYVPGAGE